MIENRLNELIDGYSKDIISDTISLVQIPSILDESSAQKGAPFGQPVRAALDRMTDIATRMDFSCTDDDGYCMTVEYGNKGETIGILAHLDVVPVGEGWETDPFVPVINDDKLFGRGTVDDKGPAIAALYALKAVRESGLPVRNRVTYILGCNEETGHQCIKHYLKTHEPPACGFSPDGFFPVIHAEKGILRFTMHKIISPDAGALILDYIHAGTVVNAVPDHAEAHISGEQGQLKLITDIISKQGSTAISVKPDETGITIIAFGKGAHAMSPWKGENAVQKLVECLATIPLLSQEVHDTIDALHDLLGKDWTGSGMGIAAQDQLSGNLSFNPGILDYEKNDGNIVCKIDVRCPVHVNLEFVWETIANRCKRAGFEAEYWQMRPPLYISKDDPLVTDLMQIYNIMMGTNISPITIGGGTYCRDVRNFVSFGPVFPGEPEMAHQSNEFISIEDLILSAKLYAQALYQLMK